MICCCPFADRKRMGGLWLVLKNLTLLIQHLATRGPQDTCCNQCTGQKEMGRCRGTAKTLKLRLMIRGHLALASCNAPSSAAAAVVLMLPTHSTTCLCPQQASTHGTRVWGCSFRFQGLEFRPSSLAGLEHLVAAPQRAAFSGWAGTRRHLLTHLRGSILWLSRYSRATRCATCPAASEPAAFSSGICSSNAPASCPGEQVPNRACRQAIVSAAGASRGCQGGAGVPKQWMALLLTG